MNPIGKFPATNLKAISVSTRSLDDLEQRTAAYRVEVADLQPVRFVNAKACRRWTVLQRKEAALCEGYGPNGLFAPISMACVCA